MKRVWIVASIAAMLAGAGMTACQKGDPTPKQVVVGIVNVTPLFKETVETFKKGMAEKGYLEGQQIAYVDEGPLGQMDKVDGAIQRILEKKPDLILSFTTPVAKKVQQAVAGTEIPVLFAPSADPVAAGLVKDLKAPGGQLTGVHVMESEDNALGWLCKLVPNLQRIYVPYYPKDRAMVLGLKGLKEVADKRNIELVMGEFQSEKELPEVLNGIPQDVQAVWQLPSPFWGVYVYPFVKACLDHRKPLKTHANDWGEAGAFMAYGMNTRALGFQLSRLSHKILTGTSPGVLPVEQPEFFLTINLRTARAVGIEIPDSTLKLADEVIR